MRIKKSILAMILLTVSSQALATDDRVTLFLKSCAYGSLAGAALGLVTLSISENPNNKSNQVARGASLGLYAGIGYGSYLIQKGERTDFMAGLSPSVKEGSLDGGNFFLSYRFF